MRADRALEGRLTQWWNTILLVAKLAHARATSEALIMVDAETERLLRAWIGWECRFERALYNELLFR